LHPNVTFLIGENGTRKSTLLEAIAVEYGFNPEGGSKNFLRAERFYIVTKAFLNQPQKMLDILLKI